MNNSLIEKDKIEILCMDSYEAEKLASIFSKQKDGSTFVSEIVKIIDVEVVVKLKDGSHHSIMLRNAENAAKLQHFFNLITQTNSTVSHTEHEFDKAIFYRA